MTPVLAIVDAAQDPEAKAMFLAGQLNVAVCPNCGQAGVLNTPTIYHDPDKEILFTYVPTGLGLPEVEGQRIVGDLTNRLISSLPAEKRKGYLLRPRSFLQPEAMIEAILEAEGITREMLAAQRARAALLERLLRTPSQETRQVIARENDDQIDYEFFQLLALNLQMAQTQGQEGAAQQLFELRQQLLNWTTTGQEATAQQEAIRDLGTDLTREKLLDKLVAAARAGEMAKVETMVAVARPLVDYPFYQQLADQIEAAERAGDEAGARTLQELRSTILDLTAELDAEMQEIAEETSLLLEEIVNSDDVEGAIRVRLPHLDQLFMELLVSNLQAAERSGNTDRATKLRQIGDTLVKMVEQSQPAEIQLINRLLAASYPEGTQALLEENRQMVDLEFIEVLKLVEEDLVTEGRQELAHRLAQICEQAARLAG